jgi:hypothetical protein
VTPSNLDQIDWNRAEQIGSTKDFQDPRVTNPAGQAINQVTGVVHFKKDFRKYVKAGEGLETVMGGMTYYVMPYIDAKFPDFYKMVSDDARAADELKKYLEDKEVLSQILGIIIGLVTDEQKEEAYNDFNNGIRRVGSDEINGKYILTAEPLLITHENAAQPYGTYIVSTAREWLIWQDASDRIASPGYQAATYTQLLNSSWVTEKDYPGVGAIQATGGWTAANVRSNRYSVLNVGGAGWTTYDLAIIESGSTSTPGQKYIIIEDSSGSTVDWFGPMDKGVQSNGTVNIDATYPYGGNVATRKGYNASETHINATEEHSNWSDVTPPTIPSHHGDDGDGATAYNENFLSLTSVA